MTILAAVQNFAAVVGMEVPEMLFGDTERSAVEIRALAKEMAARITEHHDWSALAQAFTIPAGEEIFTLPADFARFRQDTALTTPTGRLLNKIDRAAPDYFPLGGWYVTGRTIVVKNGPGDVLTGSYQSNAWALAEDGNRKGAFDVDGDSFVLPERLLTLAMIWQWKANKGLPYGQDYDNYERALGQAVAHDGPRTVMNLSSRGYFDRAKLAWPGVVGPVEPSEGQPFDFVALYQQAKQ